MALNSVDILLCLVILLVTFIGYKKGAVETILDLVKWTASIACGFILYHYTKELAATYYPEFIRWYFPAVLAGTFIIFYLLLSLLQRWVIKRDDHLNQKTFADKLTGIVPGLLMGIVISSILVRLLTFSVNDEISQEATKSEMNATIKPFTFPFEEKITASILNNFPLKISAAISQEPNPPDFKTETVYERPDLEYDMFLLLNEERQKLGLKTLKLDDEMKQVARDHSSDMFQRGYFAHITPEGINPFQRMKEAKINYRKAGENLALAQTLEEAHKGLMNSPSHRAAILNSAFGRVGIGIMDGGKNGLMISQEFRD